MARKLKPRVERQRQEIVMPTPERMKHAEGYFHVGSTGTITVLDGIMARLVARGVVSDLQFYAAVRFHSIWHHAGLEPGPRSVDFNRVYAPDPFDCRFLPATERAGDAREQYRGAVQCLGLRGTSVVEGVCCHGQSLEDVGRRLGWKDSKQARAAATELLRSGLDTLVGLWKLGGRS